MSTPTTPSEWIECGGGFTADYGRFTTFRRNNVRVEVPDAILHHNTEEIIGQSVKKVDDVLSELEKVTGEGFITTDMRDFAIIACKDIKNALKPTRKEKAFELEKCTPDCPHYDTDH